MLRLLLLALPLAAALAGEACVRGDDACPGESDEGALLQRQLKTDDAKSVQLEAELARLKAENARLKEENARTEQFPQKCFDDYSEASVAKPLVDRGIPAVNWAHLPEMQPWDLLEANKVNGRDPTESRNRTWGVFSPADGVKALYEGTKVSGVFENCPDILKGVFWMDGNADVEELAVLQFGQWFEEENMWISTMAPYSWAWINGMPNDPPSPLYYQGPIGTFSSAQMGSYSNLAISWQFSRCPEDAIGHYCDPKDKDPLGYANMQLYNQGNLLDVLVHEMVPIPPLDKYTSGNFTLQKLEDSASSEPGSLWKRTCFWGPGTCKVANFGSYDLKKIMNKDGEPVEPYYSQFIEYMGNANLWVWTGWTSKETRAYDVTKNENNIKDYYERNEMPPPDFGSAPSA